MIWGVLSVLGALYFVYNSYVNPSKQSSRKTSVSSEPANKAGSDTPVKPQNTPFFSARKLFYENLQMKDELSKQAEQIEQQKTLAMLDSKELQVQKGAFEIDVRMADVQHFKEMVNMDMRMMDFTQKQQELALQVKEIQLDKKSMDLSKKQLDIQQHAFESSKTLWHIEKGQENLQIAKQKQEIIQDSNDVYMQQQRNELYEQQHRLNLRESSLGNREEKLWDKQHNQMLNKLKLKEEAMKLELRQLKEAQEDYFRLIHK